MTFLDDWKSQYYADHPHRRDCPMTPSNTEIALAKATDKHLRKMQVNESRKGVNYVLRRYRPGFAEGITPGLTAKPKSRDEIVE